ncbi:hypothetical protein HAZT_HAZT005687, partial [Hyalella azteca]
MSVVGSGSAGSVVAGRLAEVPDWDVLVFETGGQPPALFKIPAFYIGSEFPNATYKNEYKTPPQKYTNRFAKSTEVEYTRGKVIGGSGTINQLMYHRGNPQDYDNWAALGNTGWNYKTVLEYFKKSEDYQGPVKPRD